MTDYVDRMGQKGFLKASHTGLRSDACIPIYLKAGIKTDTLELYISAEMTLISIHGDQSHCGKKKEASHTLA